MGATNALRYRGRFMFIIPIHAQSYLTCAASRHSTMWLRRSNKTRYTFYEVVNTHLTFSAALTFDITFIDNYSKKDHLPVLMLIDEATDRHGQFQSRKLPYSLLNNSQVLLHEVLLANLEFRTQQCGDN